MSETLKPCPFCGSAAEQWKHHIASDGDICPIFHVGCRNQLCFVRPVANVAGQWGYPRKDDLTNEQAQEKATAEWNRRAPADPLDKLTAEQERLGLYEEAQPVAWMTASDWGKLPNVTDDLTVASSWRADHREVTPLYAAPRAPAQDDAFRSRVSCLLADLDTNGILSEQQCARVLGEDLIAWRTLRDSITVRKEA